MAAHGSPHATRPGVRGGGDEGRWQAASPTERTNVSMQAATGTRMCEGSSRCHGEMPCAKEKGPGWKPGPLTLTLSRGEREGDED